LDSLTLVLQVETTGGLDGDAVVVDRTTRIAAPMKERSLLKVFLKSIALVRAEVVQLASNLLAVLTRRM